jgi:hypothetical protein
MSLQTPNRPFEGDQPSILSLLEEYGGSYAVALGIELDRLRPEEVYKWFLAAVLYGARISEKLATRTWHEFEYSGVLTPQHIINSGWDGLVRILDRGGYTRYDYKTATKLLDINHTLLADYGGNLNALHASATDSVDLERRVMALGKGIGPTTAGIFLRELRGRWTKAAPPLSPLAVMAAYELGLQAGEMPPDAALSLLQRQWQQAGRAESSFCDFEAALVRAGMQRRRGRARGSRSRA